jgi:hypothetical protein
MDQVELKRCKHEKKGSSFVVLHYSLETHSLIQIAPVPCHTLKETAVNQIPQDGRRKMSKYTSEVDKDLHYLPPFIHEEMKTSKHEYTGEEDTQ